jgi:hypothetical protein
VNRPQPEEGNENIAKESGTNEELEQIQLSLAQENDRNSRLWRKLAEGLKRTQYSIVSCAGNTASMVHVRMNQSLDYRC